MLGSDVAVYLEDFSLVLQIDGSLFEIVIAPESDWHLFYRMISSGYKKKLISRRK